ncbi:hypothetical protein BDN72DRAFT_249256 [Pluteus cervinus]|uniref:Uncharacterized protein n=1 Tax=Pluteus cervinus TaxID=181527 RepID=A0ACD3B5T9_9AGAR|nr:hypothetical protein BDN72DRAFT_249256 [Pluteus cervinus]
MVFDKLCRFARLGGVDLGLPTLYTNAKQDCHRNRNALPFPSPHHEQYADCSSVAHPTLPISEHESCFRLGHLKLVEPFPACEWVGHCWFCVWAYPEHNGARMTFHRLLATMRLCPDERIDRRTIQHVTFPASTMYFSLDFCHLAARFQYMLHSTPRRGPQEDHSPRCK